MFWISGDVPEIFYFLKIMSIILGVKVFKNFENIVVKMAYPAKTVCDDVFQKKELMWHSLEKDADILGCLRLFRFFKSLCRKVFRVYFLILTKYLSELWYN